ncbi:hypothetical protein KY321_00070 [Candidatus Woesearchaeota archaeon]|nr:hypothetical protein [Candidatus Woesearchaeota archaeon]
MLHKELFQVNNEEDLEKAINNGSKRISLNYQIDENDKVKLSNFKYIRVYDNIDLLRQISHKNNFVEAIIPIGEYIDDNKMVELKVDRMIFEFNSKEQLKIIDKLFSDLILNDQYPFVRGIPMCNIKIEHSFELFNPVGSNKKECENCIYKTHCSYNKNFDLKPKEKDKEFSKFIKNEGIIHRI